MSLVRIRPGARQAGFTLIELAIALVVAAILAAIAYPSYINQVRKGRRSDAIQAAVTVTQTQENWRSNNSTYGSLVNLGVNATSSGGYYGLALSAISGSGYTLTLTPQGTQTGDSNCSPMVVSVTNGNPSYSPSGCWSQ